MALKTTDNSSNPDWAKSIKVLLGPTGDKDTMAEDKDMGDLGAIDTDALTIETADGTVLELKDINGKLLARLQQEPTVTINFTLLSPSEATRDRFWTIKEEGTESARKLKVVSLVQNTPMSLRFANVDTPGSETFETPKCSVSINMVYAANKGYTGTCKAVLMWPKRDEGIKSELFQFGVVPTPSAPVKTVVR